eukprot:CAMPEP_0196779126 /NCGR_PEP_ID=MMETSP1104-20130614/6195_1 /TAXON_ID=33652 /ORGANISM="Cafeteria sp., Strain Caron Lab Isolate" /LENGTH=237 /DNA_ID=CAMNT_0042149301 /DNA_START=143 /DNA_END=852 /DNA_ORIENTATION=-
MFFAYYRQDQHVVNFIIVTLTFCIGVAGAVPVSLCELLLTRVVLNLPDEGEESGHSRSLGFRLLVAFCSAFLVAALVEEVFKFIIGYAVVSSRNMRNAYGIFVIALSASLGFAALENVAYIMDTASTMDDKAVIGVAIARGCLSVPLHAATGSLIGVGLARFANGEDQPMWKVLLWPFLIHGFYDFALMGTEATGSKGWQAFGLVVAFTIVLTASLWAYQEVRKLSADESRGTWRKV